MEPHTHTAAAASSVRRAQNGNMNNATIISEFAVFMFLHPRLSDAPQDKSTFKPEMCF
jgi:hypothetical protein